MRQPLSLASTFGLRVGTTVTALVSVDGVKPSPSVSRIFLATSGFLAVYAARSLAGSGRSSVRGSRFTCSVATASSRVKLTSFSIQDGSLPLRPMPYIHQMAPIVNIQPVRQVMAMRKPVRMPVLVASRRYTEPQSTTTPVRTTKTPRTVGSKAMAARIEVIQGLLRGQPAAAPANVGEFLVPATGDFTVEALSRFRS